MKNSLLIIFIINSILTSGQVQKNFFVDDVKSIEYVTVNFCVNNEAKINKVTVVENKTTYTNKENIEKLREYLLSIEYYPDSKLKNNCYDSTFEFINYNYETKELSRIESNKCKYFKTGNFEYAHPVYKETKIKRGNKAQIEYKGSDKQVYLIKWDSNCNYIMTYEKMTNPRLKKLIGKQIYVEIIDITENSYVYRSKSDFEDETNYGVIKKLY